MITASVKWGENGWGISKHKIKGYVEFYQENYSSDVLVTVYLVNLSDGYHGFHVHEKSLEEGEKLSDVESCCDKLGGHFNVGKKWSLECQSGTKHGKNGHTGDLCNNIFSKNKVCCFSFRDQKISLYQKSKACIIGRSIVIHEKKDDLGLVKYSDEQKNIDKFITGNAGKRIACGNIKIEEKKL